MSIQVNKYLPNGQPVSPLLILDRNPAAALFQTQAQFKAYLQQLRAIMQKEPQQRDHLSSTKQENQLSGSISASVEISLHNISEDQNQSESHFSEADQFQSQDSDSQYSTSEIERPHRRSNQDAINAPQRNKPLILARLNQKSAKRMNLGRPVVDLELQKQTMSIVKNLYDNGFAVNKPLIECVENFIGRSIQLKSASHFYKFKKRFEKYLRYHAYYKFGPVKQLVRREVYLRLRQISGIYHNKLGKLLTKNRPSLQAWSDYFELNE